MSLLGQKLAEVKLRHEDVEVPGAEPGTVIIVRIKQLGGERWDEWQKANTDRQKKTDAEYCAGLVMCCAEDPETGERLTEEDRAVLTRLPIAVLNQLALASLALNGTQQKN